MGIPCATSRWCEATEGAKRTGRPALRVTYLYDALLYLALAAGVLAGRVRPAPRALDTSSRATVVALVASLGLLLESAGNVLELQVLVPAILVAVALVGSSALLVRLLGGRAQGRTSQKQEPSLVPWWKDLVFPAIILVALVIGWEVAASVRSSSSISGTLLDGFLLILLFQMGWCLRGGWADLRAALRPLSAAVGSAAFVGSAYAFFGGVPWRTAFAVVGAFGWYSLAGPLVAQAAGPTLGLIAFLVNFLRENLTMTASPLLARAGGAEGIIAAGGATSMDTTMLFAVEHGGRHAGATALATGTVLTLVAPFLLAALLGTL
jgi:uncharacterized membrane protein YbjE (DUF340 family)